MSKSRETGRRKAPKFRLRCHSATNSSRNARFLLFFGAEVLCPVKHRSPSNVTPNICRVLVGSKGSPSHNWSGKAPSSGSPYGRKSAARTRRFPSCSSKAFRLPPLLAVGAEKEGAQSYLGILLHYNMFDRPKRAGPLKRKL